MKPDLRTFTLQLYDQWAPPPFQGPLRPPMFNGHPISHDAYNALFKAFGGQADDVIEDT